MDCLEGLFLSCSEVKSTIKVLLLLPTLNLSKEEYIV